MGKNDFFLKKFFAQKQKPEFEYKKRGFKCRGKSPKQAQTCTDILPDRQKK